MLLPLQARLSRSIVNGILWIALVIFPVLKRCLRYESSVLFASLKRLLSQMLNRLLCDRDFRCLSRAALLPSTLFFCSNFRHFF